MTLKEYQKLCKKTAKTHKNKKTLYHGNDQKEGIKENIGDTMWYLAMICNSLNWDFEEVLQQNIEKLKKRYPQGFTEKAASRGGSRVDWNEKE